MSVSPSEPSLTPQGQRKLASPPRAPVYAALLTSGRGLMAMGSAHPEQLHGGSDSIQASVGTKLPVPPVDSGFPQGWSLLLNILGSPAQGLARDEGP